jgi:hypothetical protein
MDQSCSVVHKSRRPQASVQTAKLFCNDCGFIVAAMLQLSTDEQLSDRNYGITVQLYAIWYNRGRKKCKI